MEVIISDEDKWEKKNITDGIYEFFGKAIPLTIIISEKS